MDQRNRGAAVQLVSEDLDEILELADCVAVMSGGTINYVAPIGETDRATIDKHTGALRTLCSRARRLGVWHYGGSPLELSTEREMTWHVRSSSDAPRASACYGPALRTFVESPMPQDRRRRQTVLVIEPEDLSAHERLLQLVPRAEENPQDRSERIAAKVMHLLRTKGLDVRVALEAADALAYDEDETPRTLH